MPRVTINAINAALADAGIAAEIFRGNGYWYFIGADMDLVMNPSVGVFNLGELTVTEWVEEARQRVEKAHA